VAVLIATLPISLCLRAIDAWVEHDLPHAAFLLMPTLLFWSLPSMFLVGGVAGGAVEAVLQYMLRDRFPNYVMYRNAIHGYDSRRLAQAVYRASVVLATIGAILGLDWYAYFTDSEIVVNEFWSLGTERHHSYADVVSIETAPEILAPNGNRVRRREYVVRFEDGSSWSTNREPSQASPTTKAEVVEFVSSKSAKPVTELPLLRP
jgi:MFS family permease